MEACGTANYWGLVAQALGHSVKLIQPRYVHDLGGAGTQVAREPIVSLQTAGQVPTILQAKFLAPINGRT